MRVNISNLKILRDHLATRVDPDKFDMSSFLHTRNVKSELKLAAGAAVHECGTSACALGYAVEAGIGRGEIPVYTHGIRWMQYADEQFGDLNVYDRIFSSHHEGGVQDAIARIDALIEEQTA